MSEYIIRNAKEEDCAQIVTLIKELAKFEDLEDRVHMDVDTLRKDGFGPEPFYKCVVAETNTNSQKGATIIGYALYFYIYSTFDGRSSYLEDIFVTELQRGKGIGTSLWKFVAKEAVKRGCKRMDFQVLSWNNKAMRVYENQGAVDLTVRDKWHVWRMENEALQKFASQ